MPPDESAASRPEYKMIEEVRRWRREVYEQRSRMTPDEIAADEQRLIESLGLTKLLKPMPPPMAAQPHPPAIPPNPLRRAG